MSKRGNLFANLENKFKYKDKETITEMTKYAASCHINAVLKIVDGDENLCVRSVMKAAVIGTEGRKFFNAQERELIKDVFSSFVENASEYIDEIFEIISELTIEDALSLAEALTKSSDEASMSYLDIILGFAYIDGEFDDSIAERLESIYAFKLISSFAKSGYNDVPAPVVEVSDTEEKIIEFFKKDDSLYSLKDVCSYFPLEFESSIESALTSLCNKGILYNFDTITGTMYGLAESGGTYSSNETDSYITNKDDYISNSSDIEDEVLCFLKEHYPGKYTATEIMNTLSYTNQRISAAARRLHNKNKIEKIVEKKISYFKYIIPDETGSKKSNNNSGDDDESREAKKMIIH